MHRLMAFQKLDRTKIPASVQEFGSSPEESALLVELAEIDENYQQNDLSWVERCQHFEWRCEILDKLGALAKREDSQFHDGSPMIGLPEKVTVESVGAEIGVGRSTAFEMLRVARNVPADLLDELRATELGDTRTAMSELAALEPEEQRAVVAVVLEGKAKTIEKAQRILHPRIAEPDADDDEGDNAIDDETPERYYTVDLTIIARFKVPNPKDRLRDGKMSKRESLFPHDGAGHIVTDTVDVSFRERGREGLGAALTQVARKAISDPHLLADWVDIP